MVVMLATTAAVVLAVLCLVWAALHDVAARTVPDAAALALAAAGLVLAAARHTLPGSLLAAAVVAAAVVLAWLRGWLGGGDAKLLAAAALAVPPASVPALLLGVTLCGGVLCLPYLAGPMLPPATRPGGRPRTLMARALRCERRRLRRRGPLPYAVAIAAGTLLALP